MVLYLFIVTRLQHVDLNDASRGTFNSFSITLMIIGFLQSISPAVLPCIQGSQGTAHLCISHHNAILSLLTMPISNPA
jgi:DNA polymerase sigma